MGILGSQDVLLDQLTFSLIVIFLDTEPLMDLVLEVLLHLKEII